VRISEISELPPERLRRLRKGFPPPTLRPFLPVARRYGIGQVSSLLRVLAW